MVWVPHQQPSALPSHPPWHTEPSNLAPCVSPVLPCAALACRPQVVGAVSPWVDADSANAALRRDSEAALQQELGWAAHLTLQACLLPAPPAPLAAANYARVINQARPPCFRTSPAMGGCRRALGRLSVWGVCV